MRNGCAIAGVQSCEGRLLSPPTNVRVLGDSCVCVPNSAELSLSEKFPSGAAPACRAGRKNDQHNLARRPLLRLCGTSYTKPRITFNPGAWRLSAHISLAHNASAQASTLAPPRGLHSRRYAVERRCFTRGDSRAACFDLGCHRSMRTPCLFDRRSQGRLVCQPLQQLAVEARVKVGG